MPPNWHEAPASVAPLDRTTLERWWTEFRDPVLDDLVSAAVDGNLDLKIAVLRVREARAARGIAASPGATTYGIHVSSAATPAMPSRIPSHYCRLEERESMKRTFALALVALGAAALFGVLVYAVLVAAHVSEPAATTVQGLTPRRLWATIVAVLALVGVIIGGLALARPASRFGTASGRLGAIMALVAGLLAAVNGVLNLAIANGGPGTGNGVVGGEAAFVLGLIALPLGGLALVRSRRTG
jgi:hypothetical protein